MKLKPFTYRYIQYIYMYTYVSLWHIKDRKKYIGLHHSNMCGIWHDLKSNLSLIIRFYFSYQHDINHASLMSHIVTIIGKKSIWIIQYCITEPIHVSCRISDACLNLLVVFHDHVLLELFIAQHCGYCRPPLRSVFVCCPCLVCVFTWEIGKSFCHDFKLIRIFSDLLFGGLWGPMRPRSVENSSNR